MKNNFFENLNIPEEDENFETLLKCKNIIIERIVSSDNIKPKEYKQEQDEWVILMKGNAEIEVDGKKFILNEGDYIFIPSKTSHRVLKTEKGTIWLAVHIY